MSTVPLASTAADRGPELLGVSWTLTVLSTVFVGLRLYCRVHYQSRLWWDDLWMTLALVFSAAMSVSWSVYAADGGTSYTPSAPAVSVSNARLNWISQAWCIAGLMFGKLAVATLILRLQAPAKWRTYLIWTMCIILVIWDPLQIIMVFVQCHPTEALWDPLVQGACWSPWVVVDNAIAVSAYMAFMDIALAVIPVHMIWSLQMPLRRKVGICLLLSTGVFAFAMAVVKMIMLPADLDRSSDFVRLTVELFLWNACEVNVVIIAGCIPTIMPIVEKLRGRDPERSGNMGRRVLFGKNRSFGASRRSGRIPSGRHQSYNLSGKGVTATSSSDEQWINRDDANTATISSPHNADKGPGSGIYVTRQFDVAGNDVEARGAGRW